MIKINKLLNIVELVLLLLVLNLSIISIFVDANNLFFLNKWILYLISFLAVCLVWSLLIKVSFITGIVIDKKDIMFVAACFVISVVYYWVSFESRSFIYYWDYRNYYTLQLDFETYFMTHNIFDSLKWVAYTIQAYNYNWFLCLFLEFPFFITGKTVTGYMLSNVFSILMPLYFALMLLVKKIIDVFLENAPQYLFNLVYFSMISLPLMHRAFSYGQPDVFGLIFICVIIILSVDYNFSFFDNKRLVLLFITTIFLALTRRWYLYWIVAFYICYSINLVFNIVSNNKLNRKQIICNYFIFGVVSIVVAVIFLHPMLLKIISFDYSYKYSFYNKGGLFYEFINQKNYLGLIGCGVIIVGVISGVIKNFRRISLQAIGWYCISIYLFCRVQNMHYHQSLILVPSYLIAFFGLYGNLCGLNSKKLIVMVSVVLIEFNLLNTTICGFLPEIKNSFFSNASLVTPEREDIKKVEEINEWIKMHCNNVDKSVYMLPHGHPYNPDVFRSHDLPDRTVYDLLPYGSAVLGTHDFPIGLLTAKYIFTCLPFCDYSIAGKYNDAFLGWANKGHFILVESFDMENGYVFYVYERVTPLSYEEVEYYRNLFCEENELYPENFDTVFKRVIEKYDLKENN